MSEHSCRSERRGKGKFMEWTLSLGKEARTRIGGLGAGREGTLYILRPNQGHRSTPASLNPLPRPHVPLLSQMPALLAPSASYGEEGGECGE